MKKNFEEFQNLYGMEQTEPTRANLTKALELILDEVKEAYQELHYGVVIDVRLAAPKEDIDLHSTAKEFEDVRYIAGERMTNFGWDVDAIHNETHRSNMSKELVGYVESAELEEAKKALSKCLC